MIELGPNDLLLIPADAIQGGLLFHNPPNKDTVIQHLKASLSSTLDFFPALAGRLAVVEHDDDDTSSVFVLCNNSGAEFVHAVAEDLTISDILQPIYIPQIVNSFFPLNGVKNYEGTHKPLLGVQVTELVDGIFIACAINHALADGMSFMNFVNCWRDIMRGVGMLSTPPSLERWSRDSIDRPVRIHFPKKEQQTLDSLFLQERVFHFAKEKIEELKAKANVMVRSNKISSLQALLTHLWRSIVRNQGIDPEEEVHLNLVIETRQRMNPPLPHNYFGCAGVEGTVSMKAGELLHQEGLGKAALEMNKVVALHTDERIVSFVKYWLEKYRQFAGSDQMYEYALDVSGTPRFDAYGIDLGWGKPVAVRGGPGNKRPGTVTMLAGEEEGHVDVVICHSREILEALAEDCEFTDDVPYRKGSPAIEVVTAGAVNKKTTARSNL